MQLVARRLHVIGLTVFVLINDKFNIVCLDNVIFHRLQRRLSDRNYGSRRRPRYPILRMVELREETGVQRS